MEVDFVIHYTHLDNEQGGYISSYTTPLGQTVNFDTDKGQIDLDPLHSFIGSRFSFYVDGKFHYKAILNDVCPGEMGIKMIKFTEIAKLRFGLQ